MIVYKYMKVEHAIDALENGIFAARLDTFNDPYEYEGIRYLDDYRVSCLAKSAQQMLMWAYYGNHQGCCVAFNVPDDTPVMRNVEYRKDYYQHRDMNGDELIDNLYTKAYEWQHENEIRIIYHRPTAEEKLWKIVDDRVFFIADVTQVIFGLRTDFSQYECQELLKYIRDNKGEIDVKQCLLSQNAYKIKWDKQFDYVHEILGL